MPVELISLPQGTQQAAPSGQQDEQLGLKQVSTLCVLRILSHAKLPWLSPYGKLPSGLSKPHSAVKCFQEKLAK